MAKADAQAAAKPPEFKKFKVAQYQNNVPGHPQGTCHIPAPISRLIRPDEVFTVPYWVEPRNGWLPIDEGAKQRFEEFNADLMAGKILYIENDFKRLVRRDAEAEKPRYVDTPECLEKFRKKHQRRPNPANVVPVVVDERRKLALLEELAGIEEQEKTAAEQRQKVTEIADELTGRGNGSTRTADQ